jgi:hypothetical protein
MAGEQFPQAELGGRWFDDVHGAGWRLVTDRAGAESIDPELLGWFATIGGAVVELGAGSAGLSAWFDTHGIRWGLQRPDFHVYGTAQDGAGAERLLAELRGQLRADAPGAQLEVSA